MHTCHAGHAPNRCIEVEHWDVVDTVLASRLHLQEVRCYDFLSYCKSNDIYIFQPKYVVLPISLDTVSTTCPLSFAYMTHRQEALLVIHIVISGDNKRNWYCRDCRTLEQLLVCCMNDD